MIVWWQEYRHLEFLSSISIYFIFLISISWQQNIVWGNAFVDHSQQNSLVRQEVECQQSTWVEHQKLVEKVFAQTGAAYRGRRPSPGFNSDQEMEVFRNKPNLKRSAKDAPKFATEGRSLVMVTEQGLTVTGALLSTSTAVPMCIWGHRRGDPVDVVQILHLCSNRANLVAWGFRECWEQWGITHSQSTHFPQRRSGDEGSPLP